MDRFDPERSGADPGPKGRDSIGQHLTAAAVSLVEMVPNHHLQRHFGYP
jgi:hypothetical protein